MNVPRLGQSADGNAVADLVPALRTFAHALHADPVAADELVQDTLGTALSTLQTFNPDRGMKPWLLTIMRDAFHARDASPRSGPPVKEEAGMIEPGWSLDLTDTSLQMHVAIQRLPPHQREMLVLIGVLDMAYAEAASICRCSVGTVKSRLSRARSRVLADLARIMPSPGAGDAALTAAAATPRERRAVPPSETTREPRVRRASAYLATSSSGPSPPGTSRRRPRPPR